ncbi:MAG: hypothetical protein GYA51_04715, partial [Candidatus Methanofastidiosa archaeon]|nr:hypothetical protein [Candidatus Methanofastidiosa archaeon]
MTSQSRRLAELITKETKGTSILSPGEQRELYNLLERLFTDVNTSRKNLISVINTTTRVELETAEHLLISSGGTLNLNNNSLALSADLTLIGDDLTINSSGNYTITVTGNTSISGTNTGDVTLESNSGLILTGQQIKVGASTGLYTSGNNLAIDQSFNPIWTGHHTFDNTITFNTDILPGVYDTYDIGSPTAIWRKAYISEL